jgi:gliding motility-associated-like protein
MTVQRSITLFLLLYLWIPALSGQQADEALDTHFPSFDPLLPIELLAADTVDSELAVPNVFTPNGDGMNDVFEVETDGTTVYEFTVFTRSGNRIYHSLSPRIYWEGKSIEGKELPEGIYYFVIEEVNGSGPVAKAGFMHLFR